MENTNDNNKNIRNIKWSVNINNIFMDGILGDISRNHVYNFGEALAYLLQKAYLSMVLHGEEWLKTTKNDLSATFHWYHVKTEQFISLSVSSGIFETKKEKRFTFIRFKGLEIKQELPEKPISAITEPQSHAPRTEEYLKTQKEQEAKNSFPGGKIWYDS